MANNFKVFAETKENSGTSTVMSDSTFASDSERSNGSIPNTLVRSKLNNTALREATLLCTAFINALEQLDTRSETITYSPNDTIENFTTLMKNVLQTITKDYTDSKVSSEISTLSDSVSGQITNLATECSNTYVKFNTNEQGLTNLQQSNARTNIGASSFSGSYDDLTDKVAVEYTAQSLSDTQKNRARLNINAPAAQTSNSSTIANIVNIDGTAGIRAESSSDSTKFNMTVGKSDIHIYSEDYEGTTVHDFDLIARLESLGFKSGGFTISNASSITTTTNIIKKQGKRCIANLDVVVTPGTNNIELIVPSDFAPSLSQNIVVIMYSEDVVLPAYVLYPTYTLFTISGRKITLATSGTTGRLVIKIINAGWEL